MTDSRERRMRPTEAKASYVRHKGFTVRGVDDTQIVFRGQTVNQARDRLSTPQDTEQFELGLLDAKLTYHFKIGASNEGRPAELERIITDAWCKSGEITSFKLRFECEQELHILSILYGKARAIELFDRLTQDEFERVIVDKNKKLL